MHAPTVFGKGIEDLCTPRSQGLLNAGARQRQDLECAGLPCDRVCLCLVGAGVDDHIGPFGGQLQDRGAANMPTRAGQQGDWAIELTQILLRDQGAVRLQGLHKRP